MSQEATSRVRPGDTVIKFSDCARQRFGHSARWLWGKVKQPGFPKPIDLDGSPHFINREIDEYLSACASGTKDLKAA